MASRPRFPRRAGRRLLFRSYADRRQCHVAASTLGGCPQPPTLDVPGRNASSRWARPRADRQLWRRRVDRGIAAHDPSRMPTEPEPDMDSSLTLSVWTPTAEEITVSRALLDQLAKGSTPQ